MSPILPEPSDVFADEEGESFEEIEVQETAEKSTWESAEDEDGYGSEDDLLELEDEELEESLLRQKWAKDELVNCLM